MYAGKHVLFFLLFSILTGGGYDCVGHSTRSSHSVKIFFAYGPSVTMDGAGFVAQIMHALVTSRGVFRRVCKYAPEESSLTMHSCVFRHRIRWHGCSMYYGLKMRHAILEGKRDTQFLMI